MLLVLRLTFGGGFSFEEAWILFSQHMLSDPNWSFNRNGRAQNLWFRLAT